MSTPWGPDATDQDYLAAARAERDYLTPCLRFRHRACPGEEQNRADGLLYRCACPCHTREDES